jgi:hypothetical protein
MDFSSAFSTMGRITEGFEAAEFNRMLQNLTILLERLASVSQEIDPGQVSRLLDRLDRLAANLDQVVGEAQERRLVGRLDTTLSDGRVLIDNANRSFEEINRIAGAVDDSSLQRVNDILDELYTTLETTRKTVGQANDLLSQLQSDSSLAGRLIYDPALSQSVDSTLREFLRVLDQIQNRRIPVGIKFGKGKAQE